MTDLKVLIADSKNIENNPEKTMTVKEVANVFNVSEDTIKNCIRRILPNKMQNGKLTLLNEAEVACISKELKNNCKVIEQLTYEAGSQVANTTTKLEILANYKKANDDFISLLESEKNEYKQKAEIAEKALDKLTNSNDCYTMEQAAKALKLDFGRNKLFELLRTENLLNKDNSPRQEQVNNGNFKVIIKNINEKIGSKAVTLVTGKGLVYLAKKFNTTIDTSVKPCSFECVA